MVLKVKVNMPKSTEILTDKAAETLAKILVNKLQPKEINQLVDLLKQDDCKIVL